jgi:hypothetical protein
VKTIEAFLRIKRKKLLQEPKRLTTGSGEGGVDRPKDKRKGTGLMKLEQPAADLPTPGTDGEQMKEMLVLLRGSIHGEPAVQGGGIEMLVLHAILR